MSNESIALLFGLVIGILSGIYGTIIALSLGGVL